MYGLRVPAVVSGIVLSLAALLLSLAPALASPNGGFLVKDGVKVEGVTQYGKTAPDGLDCSDRPGGLFDRPPPQEQGRRFTLRPLQQRLFQAGRCHIRPPRLGIQPARPDALEVARSTGTVRAGRFLYAIFTGVKHR